MLAVKSGKAIRFEEEKTRPMGRNASGVRGIRLADDRDEVVGMIAVMILDRNFSSFRKWIWKTIKLRRLPNHKPRWKRSKNNSVLQKKQELSSY